jgi:cytochrome bd-type quinol oxidase subunit 2
MSVDAVLTAIQNSAVAHVISKSDHLVAAGLQIVHILGFVILLGSLVLISLRVLGLVFTRQPLEQVARDSIRLIWFGLAVAVVSGTLMFVSTPKLYFYNSAFEMKMLLFVVAIALQVTVFRKVVANQDRSPAFARISVTLSLVAWFGIGMAGRAIGFV